MENSKFIRYTFVDIKTGRPVTREPARTGPVQPKGVEFIFAIQSSYPTGKPVFFGRVPADFELGIDMREVSAETLISVFSEELKREAKKRKKAVELGGIQVGEELYVSTSEKAQTRLNNLLTTVMADEDMEFIDFQNSDDSWTTMPREQVIETAKLVNRHVQDCFSWNRTICGKIDLMEANESGVGQGKDILKEIQQFGISYEETEEVVEEMLEE